METEKQTQNAEFQPSEADSIRVAVIEYCDDVNPNWCMWEVFGRGCMDTGFLRGRCECFLRKLPNFKFRYRFGTLTLDPADKFEIFKSE